MRKVLVQLDTDAHASTFDAIAALDAGVDVLLPYGAVTPDAVPGLIQGAMFPRGPKGARDTAVWIGGSRVRDGELLMDAVLGVLFDPFRLSVMHDSDGCNTTAAATVARVRNTLDVSALRAIVIGAGPVGLRSAELLRREGAEVLVSGVPGDLFGGGPFRRAAGLAIAADAGFEIAEPQRSDEMPGVLDGAAIAVAAAPAGMCVVRREMWAASPSLKVIVDLNAAEPSGVEGVSAVADLEEHGGTRVLGALAVGATKMKVQRACISALFDSPGRVLDLDEIYDVATDLV